MVGIHLLSSHLVLVCLRIRPSTHRHLRQSHAREFPKVDHPHLGGRSSTEPPALFSLLIYLPFHLSLPTEGTNDAEIFEDAVPIALMSPILPSPQLQLLLVHPMNSRKVLGHLPPSPFPFLS
jgi:hypothetical protein